MRLLIDGDVYLYKALHAVGRATEWPGHFWTWHCDFAEARFVLDSLLVDLCLQLGSKEYVVCLSDPAGNWRKELAPDYKANRKGKKPLCYGELYDYVRENHPCASMTHAEADDVMGIMHTTPGADTLIVSIDKDMRTLPGKLTNPDRDLIIEEISAQAADYNHLFQTLTGDTTDGYSGCPRIGPKTAPKILLEDPAFSAADAWPRVVAAFEKAGLGEEEAIVQAKLARILRHGEYDPETQTCLWTPPA